MLDTLDRTHSDALGEHVGCPRPEPCTSHTSRPAVATTDDVARFVRDPFAFAASAGASVPDTFVKNYLKGLEARLAEVVGAPSSERYRLATLTADALAVGDPVELAPEAGERSGDLDRSPRMGPVVAAAVVTAAAAVVTAACAVATLALAKHDAK